MSTPLCVVFSDAFAYRTYHLLGGLGEGYSPHKIIPGIGYSSNLHYLLFDGKTPDELGFFTDYTWRPAKDKKQSSLHRICDEIETANNLYRMVSRKLIKAKGNIPFSEQAYFFQNGKYKFSTENPVSVFGQPVDMAYEGNNMIACFERAQQYITAGSNSVAVVLEELDHTGHATGSLGKRYIESATEILERTNALFSLFREKNKGAVCVLISDHGMSDVYASVNVYDGLKRKFGLPGSSYQLYMDSVYLRLWSDQAGLLQDILNFLIHIDVLVLIDTDERKKYGVTQRRFGDAIFRLKEGYVFMPNFFGVSIRGGIHGIHGFLEPTDSASGFLVSNREICDMDDIEAYEVFERIRAVL